MTIQPPVYEWSATTAQEAETSLEAATNLIDAHLKTLVPGDAYIKSDTRRNALVGLRISLDLGPLLLAINESRVLNDQLDLDIPSDS
ncbi:hypothetical protein ABR738_00450 [Streptomyces sp. Edi4]|uniref:hypothetical protein n=1 Tax=Streptomyces sp. Edi4 TaxID=3162527 RepID=UPI003305BD21